MSRSKARLLWGLLLAVGLAGCSGQSELPAHPTSVPSTWSRPLALVETTLTGSPAAAMTDTGWVLAWTEDASLRFAAVRADGTVGTVPTAVLGHAPWNLTLLPVPGGDWHLLWQDTDWLGEVRLYSALLQSDGTLRRGPLPIAPDPITGYAAAVGADGTAAVVWSDAASHPQLFGRAIDAAGRPSATGPQTISSGAAHPALVAEEDGGWRLAWLQRPASPHAPDTLLNVMLLASTSGLPWDGTAQPEVIGAIVLGGPIEYVEQLSLGLDETTGYLLATTRHAGTGQVSSAMLPFDRATLTPLTARRPLTVAAYAVEGAPAPDTDFNVTAQAAPLDTAEVAIPTMAIGWSTPADSQRATLPLALDVTGHLQIAYFQQGELLGLEWTNLDTARMRWPLLRADAAGNLSLIWIVPGDDPDSPGRVWMTTTRPVNLDE